MEHRNNVNLSLFIQLTNVNNNKMNEKRSQEYQTMSSVFQAEPGQFFTHILHILKTFKKNTHKPHTFYLIPQTPT